jgi:hypothetical protein
MEKYNGVVIDAEWEDFEPGLEERPEPEKHARKWPWANKVNRILILLPLFIYATDLNLALNGIKTKERRSAKQVYSQPGHSSHLNGNHYPDYLGKMEGWETPADCGDVKIVFDQKRKGWRTLPLPEGSYKEGSGSDYMVILPIKERIMNDRSGSVLIKVKQNVIPEEGIDRIGIRTKAGWSFGKPGEDISVRITYEEWDGYVGLYDGKGGLLGYQDIKFQAAAFREMPDGSLLCKGSYPGVFR